MKLRIIAFLLLFSNLATSQSTIRVFGGANLSNTVFHKNDLGMGTDSSGLRRGDNLLPFFGADIGFTLTKKLIFSTGLGVSWMGSKDYQQDIPDIYNVDSNLRLGYIRLPLILNYSIINKLKVSCGYSFNYNFRKNQQFYTSNDQSFELIDIYKPIHHAIYIGLIKEFGNVSIAIGYHKGISRIYDTKSHHENYRIYLDLRGMQFTIGYVLRE